MFLSAALHPDEQILELLDTAPLDAMAPNNDSPFARRLSICCITFSDHPMHGVLGNFFDCSFSLNFDFKDLSNQTNNDSIQQDAPALVSSKTSDHIKSCFEGHTSDVDKNSNKPLLQGLPTFPLSDDLHTGCKRILSDNNFKQGITCVDAKTHLSER